MLSQEVKGYRLIVNYLGLFTLLIGLIVLIPLSVLIFYPNERNQASNFIIPGVLSILIGYMLIWFSRGKIVSKLDKHQDTLLILSIWIVAILISSIPFLLTGNYNFTQSIFESTSGYSTTGLTVVDVSQTPHIFLFYRSLLQFVGGVGLVLVLTSAISDRHGMRLYHAEGHSDTLVPNLIKSARLILSIYFVYILLGTMFYVLFGMSPFDGLNHAIASVSTGGFSTKVDSIGHYQSFPIEVVTIVLMLLGSTNLVIHIMIFKRKFRKSTQHNELWMFLILMLIFLPLLTLDYMHQTQSAFIPSLRIGLFQWMTALTTTGFQTIPSFSSLSPFFNLSVIILMIIGGGLGSTAGGIKQYRIALSLKQILWNVRDRLSHKKTLHVNYSHKFGKEIVVAPIELSQNNSYIMLYLITLLIGTLIFTWFGYTFEASLFEFASALGTVGLSIGVISYHAHPVVLWTASIGMLLGRLEFYVIILGISKLYLDLTHKKVI